MIGGETLARMASVLVDVPGVQAVVLGGSRARGTHTPTSDFDLGLYYDPALLDQARLAHAAGLIAGVLVVVAGPGAWGPWVDGGAWLRVDDQPIDLILRDVGRVAEQCQRARHGQFGFHAQPGHPLGFLDVSYAGEVAVCRPLADPLDVVGSLKSLVTPYPPALTRAMIDNLWQAWFVLDSAAKGAARGDVAYVALCCSTAAMVCAHAWHAEAEQWVLNEEDLVPGVARLPLDSADFVDDVTTALAALGDGDDRLQDALVIMRRAVAHTVSALA